MKRKSLLVFLVPSLFAISLFGCQAPDTQSTSNETPTDSPSTTEENPSTPTEESTPVITPDDSTEEVSTPEESTSIDESTPDETSTEDVSTPAELTKLAAPVGVVVNLVPEGRIIAFAAVDHASGYHVKFLNASGEVVGEQDITNGGLITVNLPEGEYKLQVMAKGDKEVYDDSDYGAEVSYVVAPAVKLDAPVIKVVDEEFTWDAINGASKYLVKVDDGEFVEARNAYFEYDPGHHSVQVKAIGDGISYTDSDVATYEYEVIMSDINIEKTSPDTATITYTGIKAYVDDEEFTGNTYTATKTGEVMFEVKGGYDEENHIYYNGNGGSSALFVVAASDNYIIEDATDKEAADLTDDWDIKKYDNTWKDTSASIGVAQAYGSDVVVLNAWNNYTAFRYSTNYSAKDAYEGISFDMKGDDIVTIKIQLMNSDSGIYATYNLGTISSNWAHYVIAVNDDNWAINFDGNNYKFADVIAELGMVDTSEVISCFDMFNIILTGATPNGAQTKVYLDNIQFDATVEGTKYSPYLGSLVTNYVASANKINYRLTITNPQTGDATLETLNLTQVDTTKDEEISIEVVASISGDQVLLKDKASDGSAITVEGKFANDGASVKVLSTSGTYANMLEGATFAQAANVNLDFEDGAGSDKYINDKWTQYYYGDSGWVATSNQMNSRTKNGSKIVNFYSGGKVTYLYKYNEFGSPLGLVDYVSIDLGNYYKEAPQTIGAKVALVDTKNKVHYLLGDGDNFYAYPVTTDLVRLEKYLDEPIDVKFLQVAVRSAANNSYLYADNFIATFKGKEEIKVANVLLDFEGLTVGNEYKAAGWTKEKYDEVANSDPVVYDWQSGGAMYVKEKNGSTVVNFYSGGDTTYRYTYTPVEGIGLANYLSIDLGNYYSGVIVPIKIAYITTDNVWHYVLGSKDDFYQMPVTTGLEHYATAIEEANIKSIVLVGKASGSKGYIYMDNLTILHDVAKANLLTVKNYASKVQDPHYTKVTIVQTYGERSQQMIIQDGDDSWGRYSNHTISGLIDGFEKDADKYTFTVERVEEKDGKLYVDFKITQGDYVEYQYAVFSVTTGYCESLNAKGEYFFTYTWGFKEAE